MRYAIAVGLFVVLMASLTGCSTMNSFERQEYQVMKMDGVVVTEKEPALAAGLGLLPGCGSFYTRQYALGILDLFLWPVSICWDPFIAYNEAETINYHASKVFVNRLKAKQMQELDTGLAAGRITQAQYIQQKHAIESRFGAGVP